MSESNLICDLPAKFGQRECGRRLFRLGFWQRREAIFAQAYELANRDHGKSKTRQNRLISGSGTTMLALAALLLSGISRAETISGQHAREFDGTVTRHVHFKYLLFIPDAYEEGEGKRWPLIMYLHGGSRRGDDIEKLREPGYGLPALIEKNRSFPFLVLSPQCPEGESWSDTEALIAVLDEVENKYAVDPARVYLTGHSMGGFGTWYLAYEHPERFAAIAPMSAYPFTVTSWAAKLKDMPIWAFHGANDNLAPIGDTRELVDALRALGNNVRFTVLPNRDHYILDTYENQELYSWFLAHVRATK
jgi:predicted peptidase